MFEPSATLDDAQIRFFLDEGYLAIDAITTPQEVNEIRRVYDRLFAERAGRDEGNQYDLAGADEDDAQAVLPQIMNPSKYAPELIDTQFRANARAIARQIFGPAVEPWSEHMIYKPAHYGAPTPWHQDQAYHDPAQRYRSVTIWMPLQEATVQNGCLQFVPRSHLRDVLPHQPINNDPRAHGLELVDPESHVTGAVACPIPAGGATMHHSYMLHYAGPNHSDVPRRAYILAFALPPQKREKPLAFPWLEQRRPPSDLRAAAAAAAREHAR